MTNYISAERPEGIKINTIVITYTSTDGDVNKAVTTMFNAGASVHYTIKLDGYQDQHPRDWYDCWILLDKEGITENIRKAFLLYLLSGKRPIVEMLDPLPVDQRLLFRNELEGMNEFIPDYKILAEVRVRLDKALQISITEDERLFLLSFKKRNARMGKERHYWFRAFSSCEMETAKYTKNEFRETS